jgi:uncharacterized OsmC-like protein
MTTAESQDLHAVAVTHLGDDRFDIAVRGHRLTVDQPLDAGGTDTAPTPTELFVASLAACVAFYARRYLRRHELPTEGLAVDATYETGTRPSRVTGITVTVTVPAGVPDERRDALLAVASHCTVHNSLEEAPAVSVVLS